jgi:sulfur carrier protein ThiS
MKIKLKLLAQLRNYAPGKVREDEALPLELARHTTVGDVLTALGVPADLPKVVLVNSQAAQPDQVLEDGDDLLLFPLIPGG